MHQLQQLLDGQPCNLLASPMRRGPRVSCFVSRRLTFERQRHTCALMRPPCLCYNSSYVSVVKRRRRQLCPSMVDSAAVATNLGRLAGLVRACSRGHVCSPCGRRGVQGNSVGLEGPRGASHTQQYRRAFLRIRGVVQRRSAAGASQQHADSAHSPTPAANFKGRCMRQNKACSRSSAFILLHAFTAATDACIHSFVHQPPEGIQGSMALERCAMQQDTTAHLA